MKRKIISLYVLLLMAFGYASAQERITITANNLEISDNLDLQAVASIFGDAENLEDFENRLNDPYTQISNLDLNRDGYVDYLRVVELSEAYTHLIVIQAVIGNDLYQDVATIEVEHDRYGVTTVQVVGNAYIYGPNYIIEPVYIYRPLIVAWFWGPHYRPWRSPYYWGYYPIYYRPWHPYSPHFYRTNVHVHINVHHTYYYTHVRKSGSAINMYHQVGRNDYGNRYPENSFAKRNKGIPNRSGLNQHRSASTSNSIGMARPSRSNKSDGYKSDEVRTADYDRKIKINKKAPVSTTRPLPVRQKPSDKRATTAQKSEKDVPRKMAKNTDRTQKQKEFVSLTDRSSAQKAKSSFRQENKKQSSGKSAGKNIKPSKQSNSSTIKRETVRSQPQSKQGKKSGNIKSRTDRN
ncbi:MAG: hypothetical protein KQI35_16465 [Bacteroidetes bacterium]|nr:hypothetical protein [Bacteroidota bacterium]